MKIYPTTPVEVILIDGVTRHLRYSVGAMRRLREKYGKSFLKGELLALDEDVLPDLILEGLIEKDGLDIERVADLIDLAALPYVAECFRAALGLALPEPSTDPTKASPTQS